MVECLLPKQKVASSNLVSRSSEKTVHEVISFIISVTKAEVAEWQTRRSQKPLGRKAHVGSTPTFGTNSAWPGKLLLSARMATPGRPGDPILAPAHLIGPAWDSNPKTDGLTGSSRMLTSVSQRRICARPEQSRVADESPGLPGPALSLPHLRPSGRGGAAQPRARTTVAPRTRLVRRPVGAPPVPPTRPIE